VKSSNLSIAFGFLLGFGPVLIACGDSDSGDDGRGGSNGAGTAGRGGTAGNTGAAGGSAGSSSGGSAGAEAGAETGGAAGSSDVGAAGTASAGDAGRGGAGGAGGSAGGNMSCLNYCELAEDEDCLVGTVQDCRNFCNMSFGPSCPSLKEALFACRLENDEICAMGDACQDEYDDFVEMECQGSG
jgi:hypothetical protein